MRIDMSEHMSFSIVLCNEPISPASLPHAYAGKLNNLLVRTVLRTVKSNADKDPAKHVGSKLKHESQHNRIPTCISLIPHPRVIVIIGMVNEANVEISRVESLHQWYKESPDDRSNTASVHHISTQPGVVLLPASSN